MVKFRQLLITIFIAATLVAGGAFAQTNLTQILDTITNPDGTSFNGTVVITWNGYSGSGSGTVSRLSTSARVYNGALSVLLVPTTTASPGTYYQVVYSSSNGLTSWTETWQVPPSTTALTVAAVRQTSTEGSGSTSGGSTGGSGGAQYATLPIAISNVTNLASSLSSINTTLGTVQTNASTLSSTVTGLSNTVSGLSTSLTSQGTTLGNLSTTVTAITNTVTGMNTTVNGLSSTVAAQTSSLNGLTNTVTGQATTLTSLGNTVAGINSTVAGLNTTITNQGSTLTGLGSTVTGINSTVTALNSTVTNQGSTLTNLSNTVAGLNSSVTNQAASISSLNTSVGTLNSTVSAQGSNLTSLSNSLSALNTTVSAQEASLTSLTSNLNNLTTTVAGNTSSISTVNSTVGGLSSNVTSLTNLVNGLNTTVNSLSSVASTAAFADSETPSGTINSSNTTFSLANPPAPATSLTLFRNGLVMKQGIDYTLAGSAITFAAGSLPQTGDILLAYYRMAGSGSPTNFTDAETPGGAVNGANVSFTLASAPNPAGSLRLYRNGLLLAPGAEYTLSGSAITFVTARAPQTGDTLSAYYRH